MPDFIVFVGLLGINKAIVCYFNCLVTFYYKIPGAAVSGLSGLHPGQA